MNARSLPLWLACCFASSLLSMPRLSSAELPLAAFDDSGETDLHQPSGEFPISATADAANLDALAPPCNCPECQKKGAADAKKKQAELKKAIASAYAPLFHNNKFAYINSPLYTDWYPGDRFKQIPLGCDSMLDIGGQYRARYMHEHNFRGFGLNGLDDDFLLHRTRIFANAKLGDRWRAYVEYIDAESNNENLVPRAIEVNRSDLLNLFVDYKIYENCCDGSLTGRIGRQELLYGSERLISPLDWANTRRTFEGAKLMWADADWNIDLFYTNPVFVHPVRFDSPLDDQEFFGGWATYKAIKDQTIDLYALQFNNSLGLNNFQYTSLGGRWLGTNCDWLWELEGGVQFGENTDGSAHGAGFFTTGLGRKWPKHCWKPQIWAYYDWAEGGEVRGAGQGFNHLFPLAHKYLGFMDLFGRSNIHTPNVQLTWQPHEKVKMLVWYYYFMLQNGTDTPYNVNMTPFNPGNAPASRDLGHEIDITATYAINARMDLLIGYSHFFAGQYYANTTPPPGINFPSGADFFYLQFQWNF
ncbi:hypothetical protein ETAA8_08190 [Anatilimnocola aggregata]|uniref:Alginate export domain-containing protein n=1 Tax=Anatilimnocola aggregata TaxID=2528021 RepID=A0A517Y683_9BACT|nr:alginate export family protein [Anatilimnocola aggregata]QDU25749.1 hypothetical protein ETAA8_08190 [Anatilimnocola aggregata]